MWSERPDRRRLLGALGGLLALSACGFTPVYAPDAPATGLRGQIRPERPVNRFDFLYAARIEDRLGRNEAAPLTLAFATSRFEVQEALTGTGGTLRFRLDGAVEFSVRDAGGTTLTSGRVDGFTAFSDIGTSVATRTGRADAEERLAVILADETVSRLLVTAPSWLA